MATTSSHSVGLKVPLAPVDTIERSTSQQQSHPSEGLKEEQEQEQELVLTYVEFYAGVGGWTMALEQAAASLVSASAPVCDGKKSKKPISLRRIVAMDHSDLCMRVFRHNFQRTSVATTKAALPNNQKKRKRASSNGCLNIQKVTPEQVGGVDIWAMSPPCQPHTRQHSNQSEDLQDPRSQSFLHLCQLLQELDHLALPRMLLMENVVGFEKSNSCKRWRQVLSQRQYKVAHFHLTPTQIGLPNDRPRYFCVAVRPSKLKPNSDGDSVEGEDEDEDEDVLGDVLQHEKLESIENDGGWPKIRTHLTELGLQIPSAIKRENLPQLATLLDTKDGKTSPFSQQQKFGVPEKLCQSDAAWCFDIVTPKDRHTSCFTSSYGKFIRGTGSVLYSGSLANDDNNDDIGFLVPPEERKFDADWSRGLDLSKHLRYFSGTEIARLMGFPETFRFPSDCTDKQQWKLLGNSLNVQVAAKVCELGMLFLKK